jgi:hypothetical protein
VQPEQRVSIALWVEDKDYPKKSLYFDMKTLAVFLLLFFVFFVGTDQAAGQSRVFVSPVTGSGISSEEVAQLHQKINFEIAGMNYRVVGSRNNSDYFFRGTIMPSEQAAEEGGLTTPVPSNPNPAVKNTRERREFFSLDINDSLYFYDTTGDNPDAPQDIQVLPAGSNVLVLEILRSRQGEVITRRIVDIDPSKDDLSFAVKEMLLNLQNISESRAAGRSKTQDTRSRWLFIEASALWAPRIYSNEGNSLHLTNFGGKIALDFQFIGFMTLSAGVQITQDWITVSGEDGENRDMILEIPLAIKLTLKPGNLMLEPYGGISYNYSLSGFTNPSVYSWFCGFQFGVKAGPGMIVIDPRFSMDLYTSSVVADTLEYERSMMQIGVGYKIGIFPKR